MTPIMGQPILRDEFYTPDDFYQKCVDKYGPFTLDVAASALNTKCPKFFTEDQNGLDQEWRGRVWCNPPYRKILRWVEKAHAEVLYGRAEIVVLLLPAHTATEWFHFALEYGKVEFIKGKLKFGGLSGVPFFGSVLVIFERKDI